MKKFDMKETLQRGSMMVEALAMLGLITMVTPIIYKKAAERTTELQDINIATQMRMMGNAVDEYISDNYRTINDAHPAEGAFALTAAEMAKLKEYLPQGFDTSHSKMFEDYKISVVKKNLIDKNNKTHTVYTSAVLAPLKDNMTVMRSNKIASMIGANGGVYKGGNDKKVEGSQSAWEGKLADYGLDANSPKEGSLMIISTDAIASAKGDVTSDEALFRIADGSNGGPESKNRMQTELYMGGNTVREIVSLIARSDTAQIMVGGPSKTDPGTSKTTGLLVQGSTNLNDALTQKDGAVSFAHKGFTARTQGNDATLVESTGSGTIDIKSNTGALNVEATDANVTVKAVGTNKDVAVSAGNAVKIDADKSHIYVNNDDAGAIHVKSTGKSEFVGGNVHLTGVDEYITGGKKLVLTDTTDVTGYAGGQATTSIILANGLTARNEMVVLEDYFSVGGVPSDTGNTIEITPTSSYIGRGSSSGKGLTVTDSKLEAKHSGTSLAMDNANNFALTNNTNNKLTMSGEIVKLQNVNSDITFDGPKIELGNTNRLAMTKDAGLKLSSTGGQNYLDMAGSGGKVTLKQNVNSIEMNGAANFTLSHNNGAAGGAKINMAGETLTASVGAGTTKFYATTTGPKIGFETGTNKSAYLNNDVLEIQSKHLVTNDLGMAIGTNVNTGNTSVVSNALTTDSPAKVVIRREGVIEVVPPTSESDGYIKARRLVSDVAYPTEAAYHGYGVDGVSAPSKKYDYYQVNPAYTSVMNDIKLSSRGGARLSDILPDFINKGIYVVDNTYTQETVNDWFYTVGTGSDKMDYGKYDLVPGQTGASSVTECDHANCVASPWMGFIPAPQCPRNYAKVITLSPIRWRMAEVFALYGKDEWGDVIGNQNKYKNAITGPDFSLYFQQPNDPAKAYFELSSNSDDPSTSVHTHEVTGDHPVTFQTNTWLNISYPFVYKSNSVSVDNFLGWHAVMGFVYRPLKYDALLKEVGLEPSGGWNDDDVLWNLFPVYAQDNAAIANIYCYFERHPLTGSGGSRAWTWGDSGPVYTYDQLNNFRIGENRYKKTVTVGDATGLKSDILNDPTLGYDDMW